MVPSLQVRKVWARIIVAFRGAKGDNNGKLCRRMCAMLWYSKAWHTCVYHFLLRLRHSFLRLIQQYDEFQQLSFRIDPHS